MDEFAIFIWVKKVLVNQSCLTKSRESMSIYLYPCYYFRDYVFGFQKRKEERRRIAIDEKKKKEKNERRTTQKEAKLKLLNAYEEARQAQKASLESFDKFEARLYKSKGINKTVSNSSKDVLIGLSGIKSEVLPHLKKEQIEFKDHLEDSDSEDDAFGGVVVTISDGLDAAESSSSDSE